MTNPLQKKPERESAQPIEPAQPVTTAPETETVTTKSAPQSRAIYFLIGLLVILITAALAGIILGSSLILKYQQNTLPPAPVPLQASPSAVPEGIKKHASDSAALKVKEDVKTLQSEINSMDYFQAELSPPVIDPNIQIQ